MSGGTRDYEIGFGKPPAHTRFRKGRSGNPNGRPKGSANALTALQRMLGEKIVVKENGRVRTITKRDAALKQLVNKAASGDSRAINDLFRLQSQLNADRRKTEAPETPTLEELIRRSYSPAGR